MKNILLGLGGVESIDGDLDLSCSDVDLQIFLENSLVYAQGRQPITATEVRAYQSWLSGCDVERRKDERRAAIQRELADIDMRCIRPLAEGDSNFLMTLRAPVAALREELNAL